LKAYAWFGSAIRGRCKPVAEESDNWTPLNYFNYFTEVEEHFRRARGTGFFLLSPLDWALIEGWKNSGVPMEAVLRGVDAAFEKWRANKSRSRIRMINSLAYCTQAVMEEAQRMAEGRPPSAPAEAPFAEQDLREFLLRNARSLQAIDAYRAIGESLAQLAANTAEHLTALEALEQNLTVLEEKMIAIARATQPESELLAARRDLDTQLRPYRGKMTADQLGLLERNFLDRRLIENAGLPRLSLFYLGV